MSGGAFIAPSRRPAATPRSSVQVNILAVVDVARALACGSLDDAVMLVDNSVDADGRPSPGRGTPALVTQCCPGSVLNWIVQPVGPYGLPAPASLERVAFDDPACVELSAYGEVDVPGSPDHRPGLTPSYAYWAGMVAPGLPPRRYGYRIVFRLGCLDFELSTAALEVLDASAFSRGPGGAG